MPPARYAYVTLREREQEPTEDGEQELKNARIQQQ
ncbi:hypothetical protein B6N60_03903 [Richelia sinica FACHB-800]|uniref:Uncharacterized protein n=1 Tax=Richelia sinica FACHB-800 TaxID=1357546 RepID=A0A975TAG0_9NOST|nr:hypothetical protein B6N60_03903 [Richelia sinica FACHB-800]